MLIVDRFEGDMAVIEYAGETLQLPRTLLPADLKPGDVIRLLVEIDREETEKRRRRMRTLLDSLWEES